jgi:DNA mismatch repair ATPase MutS
MSIAFSIAESLLTTEAITLFVTHYPQITLLANLYPNAKNMHLKTTIVTSTSGGSNQAGAVTDGIKYLHQIGNGACDMKSGYGRLPISLIKKKVHNSAFLKAS